MADSMRALSGSDPGICSSLAAVRISALDATDVAVYTGVEQIDHQAVYRRADKAGLGEQLLWSGLAVGLGSRREVRIDFDPPAIAVPAARVDSESFKSVENLHMVLGELHAQHLAAVDVRGAGGNALDLLAFYRRREGELKSLERLHRWQARGAHGGF